MLTGLLQRAVRGQLPADVIQAGLAAGQQLQAAGLVVAGQLRRVRITRAHVQAELLPPARRCRLEVGHPQGDVIDAGQRDHGVTRTGIRLMPLKKFERSRSAGPVGTISTPRASSSSKVIRISSRAR